MSRVLPILFNTDMVRAILDGRKTVTRRVVHRGKSYPEYHGKDKFYGIVDHLNDDYRNWYAGFYSNNDVFIGYDGGQHIDALYWKAPCKPGDTLYVRETWQYIGFAGQDNGYVYKASENGKLWQEETEGWKWRPSLHMPKEAARIWLKVTDVRVERLQAITDEQAKSEGANWKNGKNVGIEEKIRRSSVERFADIWNATIKKPDLDRYGWDANPWVFVIEFERCEKP